MAYFGEGELILYLSADHIEKQTIEDGINRTLISVKSIQGLVEELDVPVAKEQYVTIIVTKNMGEEFKMYLEGLVVAVNSVTEGGFVTVFEIGTGKLFENALTFEDVLTFLEFAKRERRIARIGRLEDEGTEESKKESQLMRELMIEVDASKEKVAQYNLLVEKKEEELQEVKAQFQALQTKVHHVYEIEADNLRTAQVNIEEELKELKRVYRIELEKVKDYEKETGEYRSKNKGLELERESLLALNEDRKRELRVKDREIEAHKREKEKLQGEKVDILRTRVDAEEHVLLSQELDAVRKQNIEMQTAYGLLEIDATKKDFLIADLGTDIAELRKGETDIHHYGRTAKLDTHRFTTTNVFYVKIITELPYLVSNLTAFYNTIKKTFRGRSHVAIIRNDEGLDSRYYPGIKVYGTLGDVKVEDEIFLLHPTRRMFTGAEKFDAGVKTLVILDFIRSSDYYATTEGFGKVVTVVRDSDMIRDLGLQGTPVSLDSGSMLEINYDEVLAKAGTARVKENMIQSKVDRWMKKIGII